MSDLGLQRFRAEWSSVLCGLAPGARFVAVTWFPTLLQTRLLKLCEIAYTPTFRGVLCGDMFAHIKDGPSQVEFGFVYCADDFTAATQNGEQALVSSNSLRLRKLVTLMHKALQLQ